MHEGLDLAVTSVPAPTLLGLLSDSCLSCCPIYICMHACITRAEQLPSSVYAAYCILCIISDLPLESGCHSSLWTGLVPPPCAA